jgi:hypothetical protein
MSAYSMFYSDLLEFDLITLDLSRFIWSSSVPFDALYPGLIRSCLVCMAHSFSIQSVWTGLVCLLCFVLPNLIWYNLICLICCNLIRSLPLLCSGLHDLFCFDLVCLILDGMIWSAWFFSFCSDLFVLV